MHPVRDQLHPGVQSWKYLLVYAFNAFSIPLLFKTLFHPFKNDGSYNKDFTILEKTVYFIVARLIGFISRIVLIGLGLLFTFFIILAFPIFFFIPIKLNKERMQRFPSFGAPLSYGNTYTLNKHSRELLLPNTSEVYGKDKALRMIERGLSKETNRNVLLVGDTGVGKTTLLAYLGMLGNSALSFLGIRSHRVVELTVEGITEEDFERSLREAEKAGNVILVIENIHGYTTLFEKLMPYLHTKTLGLVVTTDFANYDQVLKAYPEFLSKFEKIDILPTSLEETLKVLKNKVYVEHVKIENDALEEIVRLADRFIGNQPEPLKSLLVLEELLVLGKKITVEDVRQIISDKTNMPIGALDANEKKVLVDLESTMLSKIIGQDEAVKDVAEALKRLRTGISDPSKPAGSFLFLGPTGVGKTYTAKILAESYFGRKNAMIRFDMSEFSQPESISTFSDRLASTIEEAPLSLVFFDELEKAHKSIHHLLLQVLDEGVLTRESGRKASFKDAIIIATSNAGSRDIVSDTSISKKYLMEVIIKAGIFTPEFLNRFGSVILFLPLTQKDVRKVTKLLVNEFIERIKEDKSIDLEVTDETLEKISSVGFDPQFGARPIRRAIEEIIENKVADYIIKGDTQGKLKV